MTKRVRPQRTLQHTQQKTKVLFALVMRSLRADTDCFAFFLYYYREDLSRERGKSCLRNSPGFAGESLFSDYDEMPSREKEIDSKARCFVI